MSASDPTRTHRARQAVHSEKDRLLKKANRRIDLSKYLPDDGKDRARALVIALPFTFCGILPYVVMILMWVLVFYQSVTQLVLAFFTLLIVGGLFCIGSSASVLGKERRWMWCFGLVWLQAALVGLVVGFFLYFRNLAYYWKYQEMRTYTNVAAAQASSAFGDGSMFLFTEDSKLDPMRAVGYSSRWTGDTYCVAPVVDATMNQASDIHYWAVGTNCCTPRAEFFCNDAPDYLTRSALRVLEPEDVVRPSMQWAVRGATYPKYLEAIRLQEATYFTKAATKPILLHWARDPIGYMNEYYAAARNVCIQISVAYFFLIAAGSYFVAWTLVPRQKSEGIVRNA